MRTRSESVQLLKLATPPRTQSPGGLTSFRQALADGNEHGEDGKSFCFIC